MDWPRDVRQGYTTGPAYVSAYGNRVDAPANRPPLRRLNAGFTTSPRTHVMSTKTRTNAGPGPSQKWLDTVESNPFMGSYNPFLGTRVF